MLMGQTKEQVAGSGSRCRCKVLVQVRVRGEDVRFGEAVPGEKQQRHHRPILQRSAQRSKGASLDAAHRSLSWPQPTRVTRQQNSRILT